ncbi:MAG: DNA topoisomerase IV subunit A [Promethearchaeota archaeon]
MTEEDSLVRKLDLSEREKIVRNVITAKGVSIADLVEQGKTPYLEMASRSTSNITFSEKKRRYVIMDKKSRRSMINVAHLRKMAQSLWVMKFSNDLITMGRTETLRGLYYSSESFLAKFFDNQDQSNGVVVDTEAMLGYAREDFHINPASRGTVFGDVDVRMTDPITGERRDLNLGINPDGQAIGPRLIRSELLDTSAERVIALETDGMYNRLVEERVHENFNTVLVGLMGQATRGARRLLRRFSDPKSEGGLELPVYVFVDGDVWGEHIATVIKYGSAEAAHIEGLACPDAQWLGVYATDIERYDLPYDKFNKQDLKRCRDLLYGSKGPPRKDWEKKETVLNNQKPKGKLSAEEVQLKKRAFSKGKRRKKQRNYLPADPRYDRIRAKKEREELFRFWCIQRKSEQQAFNAKGKIDYVVKEFLPSRFAELGVTI